MGHVLSLPWLGGERHQCNPKEFMHGWGRSISPEQHTRWQPPGLSPPKKCTFGSAIPSLHPIRTLPSRPAQATWASCVWRGQERRRAHPGRARWKADAIFALMTFLTMSFGKNLSFVTKKVVKILLCMRSSVQP